MKEWIIRTVNTTCRFRRDEDSNEPKCECRGNETKLCKKEYCPHKEIVPDDEYVKSLEKRADELRKDIFKSEDKSKDHSEYWEKPRE